MAGCLSFLESSFTTFSEWVIPEELPKRHYMGTFYQNHPVMSRVIATPLALISGVAKVLLFPLMCAVGVITMPIIAIYNACTNQNYSSWLGAWAFCILGLGVSAAFVISFGYHMPLLASSALLIGFVTISIAAHVHAFVKEPAPVPA